MPTDKNTLPGTFDAQKNKCQDSADKAAWNKCRRRDQYKQFSCDKREAILSQRRTKYRETKSKNHPNNSSTCNSYESASFVNVVAELPGQGTLTINETANISPADACTLVSGKEKNIVGHTCIFEVGSTSGTVEQLNPEVTSARNKGTTVAHNPGALTGRNKGKKSMCIGCWNNRQLPENASILKKVPNCEYCGAKKFEYESAGFCCNNGSIKLTSNEMPAELLNLYLGG